MAKRWHSSGLSWLFTPQRFRPESNHGQAGEFFKSRLPSFETSSPYANKIIVRRLARSLRFADIVSLLESHKADPRIKEEAFLCTVIRSYGLVGMFDHALRTYEEMDSLGTSRSTLSLNALLIACNQSKHFEKVQDFFCEMQNRYKITPDEGSYRELIKSYCELGDVEKAMRKISELENRGMDVSSGTYATVSKYLYRETRVEEADKLWAEMVDKGAELDVYAYNVRIRHASDVGDLELLKELITQLEASGLKADAYTLNCVFLAYFKNGKAKSEEMKMFYEQLERSGISLNSKTMQDLIHFLCRVRDFEAGFLVLNKMMAKKIIPRLDILEYLLRGLVARYKMEEANAVAKIIWKKLPPSSFKLWKKVFKNLCLPTSYADGMLDNV